ncbi:MAG: transposase [Verrucomicrobia bacterium]|nr:transposase [Verrucomicrobiota bacterium]
MARKLRVQYPGAVYHVLNRGDRREPIFLDDHDRWRFLDTLAEACAKTGWQVHAFCLMSNHFHLVIETPQANLVAGMKWLLGTYTGRFNRRHKFFGHLFSGRYKALLVDGATPGYLRTLSEYVHLNPVRAKLLTPEAPLRSFAWSSFPLYLLPPSRRPTWLRVDRMLGEHGITQDSAAGRRQFELRLEERRRQEDTPAQWKTVRRGWCLGDETFRQELLARVAGQFGEHHYGPERQESDEQKAERLVREAMAKQGWNEEDLAQSRKSDPVKLRLAAQLRRETTMTLKWIAARLKMGSWKYLNRRLHQ